MFVRNKTLLHDSLVIKADIVTCSKFATIYSGLAHSFVKSSKLLHSPVRCHFLLLSTLNL